MYIYIIYYILVVSQENKKGINYQSKNDFVHIDKIHKPINISESNNDCC